MKPVAILFIPAILLIAGCIALGAHWFYYVVAFLSGMAIGTLGLFVWFEVNETDTKINFKNYEK